VKRHERAFAAALRSHVAIYGEVTDKDLQRLLARAGVELVSPTRVPLHARCARCHKRLRMWAQDWEGQTYGPKCYQIMKEAASA